MSFLNSNYPLGLPKGSVRAIIVLSIVGGSFIYFFKYNQFPTDLTALLGAAVGYYIGGRASDAEPNNDDDKKP